MNEPSRPSQTIALFDSSLTLAECEMIHMQEGFIFGFEVIEHIKYEFSCYIHEYFHVILYISIDQIFTLEIKQISLPSIYCLEYSFMNRYIFSKVQTYTVKPRNTRYPNTRNSNCTFFFRFPTTCYCGINS